MVETLKPPKLVGEPVKRREDPRLIQGLARYVDDLEPQGCLHIAIVASTHAHARLKSVDTSTALEPLGGGDSLDRRGYPGHRSGSDGRRSRRHEDPPSPNPGAGTVRYVGEPIAAVVAADRTSPRTGLTGSRGIRPLAGRW